MCKERGIDYIFDPGQSLPMLDGKDLIEAISGCRILISNDYELDLIMKKTGLAKEGLLERTGDPHHHPGRTRLKGPYGRRRDKHPPCKGEAGARSDRGGGFLQGRPGHGSHRRDWTSSAARGWEASARPLPSNATGRRNTVSPRTNSTKG